MSELRAPDPTIWSMPHAESVAVRYWDGPPASAHRIEYDPGVGQVVACDADEPYEFDWMPAGCAAYVAVPCRECFPEAPPPGKYPFSRNRTVLDDANLAWQVQP